MPLATCAVSYGYKISALLVLLFPSRSSKPPEKKQELAEEPQSPLDDKPNDAEGGNVEEDLQTKEQDRLVKLSVHSTLLSFISYTVLLLSFYSTDNFIQIDKDIKIYCHVASLKPATTHGLVA